MQQLRVGVMLRGMSSEKEIALERETEYTINRIAGSMYAS